MGQGGRLGEKAAERWALGADVVGTVETVP
jgi:hypothetical protein